MINPFDVGFNVFVRAQIWDPNRTKHPGTTAGHAFSSGLLLYAGEVCPTCEKIVFDTFDAVFTLEGRLEYGEAVLKTLKIFTGIFANSAKIVAKVF